MFRNTSLFPIVYTDFHFPDLNSVERDALPILVIGITAIKSNLSMFFFCLILISFFFFDFYLIKILLEFNNF
jgi:hypothetical protein